jgi:hypothetical protein
VAVEEFVKSVQDRYRAAQDEFVALKWGCGAKSTPVT